MQIVLRRLRSCVCPLLLQSSVCDQAVAVAIAIRELLPGVAIVCCYRAFLSGIAIRALLSGIGFKKYRTWGQLNVNYLLPVLVVDCSFEVRQICSKSKSIQYSTVHVQVQVLIISNFSNLYVLLRVGGIFAVRCEQIGTGVVFK